MHKLRRLLILTPLWFALVILFAGVLTPGYTQKSHAISELAAPGAPYAWLVKWGGFIPVGCSLAVLAFATTRFSAPRLHKTTAALLFGLTGLSIIVAGFFPTDPGGRRDTLAGVIHAVAGLGLLITACLAPLAITALPLRPQEKAAFRIYSFLTGLVLVALFLLTPNGLLSGLIEWQRDVLGSLFPIWYKHFGIHQRVFMLIYFVWVGVFAHSI